MLWQSTPSSRFSSVHHPFTSLFLLTAVAYLRLHGVKATEHPVYRELTRVKQYFDKIKRIETGPEKPTMQLDKAAADRFIKHALVGTAPGVFASLTCEGKGHWATEVGDHVGSRERGLAET